MKGKLQKNASCLASPDSLHGAEKHDKCHFLGFKYVLTFHEI